MKLIAVFCFVIAGLMIYKTSLQFSRFFRSYRNQIPILYDQRVYDTIIAHFQLLVRKISFWLLISGICVFFLAWGI